MKNELLSIAMVGSTPAVVAASFWTGWLIGGFVV